MRYRQPQSGPYHLAPEWARRTYPSPGQGPVSVLVPQGGAFVFAGTGIVATGSGSIFSSTTRYGAAIGSQLNGPGEAYRSMAAPPDVDNFTMLAVLVDFGLHTNGTPICKAGTGGAGATTAVGLTSSGFYRLLDGGAIVAAGTSLAQIGDVIVLVRSGGTTLTLYTPRETVVATGLTPRAASVVAALGAGTSSAAAKRALSLFAAFAGALNPGDARSLINNPWQIFRGTDWLSARTSIDTPVVQSNSQAGGGFFEVPQVPRRRTVREDRERLGIIPREVKQIVQAVARASVVAEKTDVQAEQQLANRLAQQDIEAKARYTQFMQQERDRILLRDIDRALRIRQRQYELDEDDREAELLLM